MTAEEREKIFSKYINMHWEIPSFSIKKAFYLAMEEYHEQEIEAYKRGLINKLEDEKAACIFIRDGFKKGTIQYEAYDLMIRLCEKHISFIPPKSESNEG